jgi:hypothetical protein
MRAVVQRAYGTADTLSIGEVAQPAIGAGDVLVAVRAAGLDRGTWHLMAGQPYAMRLAFGLRAPKNPVPGLDVAGVVAAVGPAVTRFRPGDEVFGIGKGSFAELTAAREDKLALKPRGLTFEQAAAVPSRASPRCGRSATWGRFSQGSAFSSSVRPAASARTQCRSPRRSAPMSPASAAPARSTSCARSARTRPGLHA